MPALAFPPDLWPPIVGSVNGGIFTAAAVLMGFWLQRRWDATTRRTDQILRSRSTVLSPLLRAIEDHDKSRDRFTFTATNNAFEPVRQLMYHSEIAYARAAAPEAMTAVDAWFVAQQAIEDHASAADVLLTTIAIQTEIDRFALQELYRSLAVIEAGHDRSVRDVEGLATKWTSAISTQASGIVTLSEPMENLTRDAIEKLRRSLTDPPMAG